MAVVQEHAHGADRSPESGSGYSALGLRARRSIEPGRIRVWTQQHRPPYQLTERSWFVMLAALCLGIAMLFEPAVFVTLAVIFACTAWWRRESARQGISTIALWALAAGAVLVVFSIFAYVIQRLLA